MAACSAACRQLSFDDKPIDYERFKQHFPSRHPLVPPRANTDHAHYSAGRGRGRYCPTDGKVSVNRPAGLHCQTPTTQRCSLCRPSGACWKHGLMRQFPGFQEQNGNISVKHSSICVTAVRSTCPCSLPLQYHVPVYKAPLSCQHYNVLAALCADLCQISVKIAMAK
jgi:hypothetical protein